MKRKRQIVFYSIVVVGFMILMYFTGYAGKGLETNIKVKIPEVGVSNWNLLSDTLFGNLKHPLSILLFQIITIILVARVFSWLCRRIGQPTVIGEIVAGIVLGPSLAGMYFPEFMANLFPAESMGNLHLLSQIGLILFMFVIGMELDTKMLKGKAYEAIVVSHASIAFPFALGMALAYILYTSFAPKGVQFLSFSLFLGISMSITAFPVLARIVQEKNINKTKLGALVIACAAVDDITAWSLLAVVIAIVKAGSFASSLPVVFMSVGYVFIMLKIIKPFLKRVGELHATRESMNKAVIAIFFLTLLISSYTTEIIGIHALFGAFMAGIIMPSNQRFKNIFIEKVEDVALVLLLPLFFVYTGLRTQVGLLNDIYLWKTCLLVIVVAVTGKFAGSALAARFVGQSWKDSLTIGALMNTRGLVELVALNIGYDLGILTPEIFTMLVIMALLTTFMTAPVLDLINKIYQKKNGYTLQGAKPIQNFKILISFGKPEMGKILLHVANAMVKKSDEYTAISALHLSHGNLFAKHKISDYENDSFRPVIAESHKLGIQINTLFKSSEDIESDIAQFARKGDYDLLLMGIGHSIYEGSMLGKLLGYTASIVNPDWLMEKVLGKERYYNHFPFDERTRLILSKTKIPVGILACNDFNSFNKILVLLYRHDDIFLLKYAQKFILQSGSHITLLDIENTCKDDSEMEEIIASVEQHFPGHIVFAEGSYSIQNNIQQHPLTLLSISGWKKLTSNKSIALMPESSVLIIRE